MNKMLDDWASYCSGEKQFDAHHFTPLLCDELSEKEIRNVFQCLSYGKSVSENVLNMFANGYFEEGVPLLQPRKENRGTSADLKSYAKLHLLDLIEIMDLQEDSEMQKALQSLTVHYTNDQVLISEAANSDSLNVDVFDNLSDLFIDAYDTNEEKASAIFEVLYGLCLDYYLAWYMGAPLINFDFTLENYYNVWRLGGEIVIRDKDVLVAHRA